MSKKPAQLLKNTSRQQIEKQSDLGTFAKEALLAPSVLTALRLKKDKSLIFSLLKQPPRWAVI